MYRQRPASALDASLAGFDRARRDKLRQSLDNLAAVLSSGSSTASAFDWTSLDPQRLRQTDLILAALPPAELRRAKRALNGLLRRLWLQGELSTECYHELTSVSWMRTTTHIGPRRLVSHEAVEAIKAQCRADPSVNGRRDLAMIALLSTGACNGAELVRLEVNSYRPADGSLRLNEKSPLVKLDAEAENAVKDWLAVRGSQDGPLLCTASRASAVQRPLTPSAVTWILRKRANQAGVPYASTEDLRRSSILSRHFDA